MDLLHLFAEESGDFDFTFGLSPEILLLLLGLVVVTWIVSIVFKWGKK